MLPYKKYSIHEVKLKQQLKQQMELSPTYGMVLNILCLSGIFSFSHPSGTQGEAKAQLNLNIF
jgi:hypothetical protein